MESECAQCGQPMTRTSVNRALHERVIKPSTAEGWGVAAAVTASCLVPGYRAWPQACCTSVSGGVRRGRAADRAVWPIWLHGVGRQLTTETTDDGGRCDDASVSCSRGAGWRGVTRAGAARVR